MAILLVLIAGAAVLNAERFAHGATITTPSDALHWAVGTMTTSGGGNFAPVVEGRLVASFLLIFGLGLLTTMTGYVANWVMKQFSIVRAERRNVAASAARAALSQADVLEPAERFVE